MFSFTMLSKMFVLVKPAEDVYRGRVPRVSLKPPSETELPRWALVLKLRRVELYRSQPRMEAATNDVLSQIQISRLERGLMHPVDDLNTTEFFALLKAFKWSLEDFERETGLSSAPLLEIWDSEIARIRREEALSAVKHLEAHHPVIWFRAYKSVSAGDANDASPSDELVGIPEATLRRHGVKRENVRVYHVNGDCMVSDGVRVSGKNIAHGDQIAVDVARAPKAGDRVVLWDDRDQKMLVKVFMQDDGEFIVFYPLNSTRPPIVRRSDEGKIIGVVFWRGG